MDTTAIKAFVNALFKFAEDKTSNPILVSIEKVLNVSVDTLIDEFVKTPAGQKATANLKS